MLENYFKRLLVLGKPLQEIFLQDWMNDPNSNSCLT